MSPKFLNTSAVAQRLNLSADRVRQLARGGELAVSATTVHGERLFTTSDVDAFEQRRREQKGVGQP